MIIVTDNSYLSPRDTQPLHNWCMWLFFIFKSPFNIYWTWVDYFLTLPIFDLICFFICGHHEVPRKHQRSSSLQCNTVRNSSAKKLCPSSHKLWLVRRKALPQFCRIDSCQLWLSFPHTDTRQKQYSQSPRLRGFQDVLGFRLLPLLSNYLKHLWVVTKYFFYNYYYWLHCNELIIKTDIFVFDVNVL